MVFLNPGPAYEIPHSMHVLGKTTNICEQNRPFLSEFLLYELVETFPFAQNACDITGMRCDFLIVFFSHQLGSFAGVWLAGWAYDVMGSYDVVWYAAIATGFAAAVLHLPIVETSLRLSRPEPEPAR